MMLRGEACIGRQLRSALEGLNGRDFSQKNRHGCIPQTGNREQQLTLLFEVRVLANMLFNALSQMVDLPLEKGMRRS